MSRLLLVIVLLFVCAFSLFAEDECFWWGDATINGKPVQFVLDTGTGPPVVLFSTAAKRLGLKVTPPTHLPDPGEVAAGTTKLCDLDLGITKTRTFLYVVEVPDYLKTLSSADGILGWQLIKNNVFMLDAVKHTLKQCKVPKNASAWTKLCLQTNLDVLGLKMSNQKGEEMTILIDTGFPDGILLNPPVWREWKTTHTNQPTTINAYFAPTIGVVAEEEAWTHEIALGPLVLTDVPVMEANSTDVALGTSLRWAI